MISRREGVSGLWRGSGSSILRNTPHSACVFTLYPKIHSQVNQLFPDTFKPVKRLLSGFLTTSMVTLFTHPLDTVRVRVSAQAPGKIRYNSFAGTVRTIMKLEGPTAFYRGLWPTILGAGPRGGIGFGVFETLKKIQTGKPDVSQKLAFGALAGMTADFCTYPLDTVRRRQQTFGRTRTLAEYEQELGTSRVQQTRGVCRTLVDILKVEGIRGLYKGAGLSMVKTPIASGISFCVNDTVKDLFIK